ncbi:hypothetical protein [Nonomuraea sp. NPDC049625]|uniref:hypothetical protein n=1 Tax=Nonomuraea sp. NPDC049625 TaxID=3155775 RepID=UPI00342460B3
MSLVGKWDSLYAGIIEPTPFGETTTYEIGARFLADCAEIEDWGCGRGWLRTCLAPGQRYRGIDGSRTPFADAIVDLTTYKSDVEAIFLRHVLEHNRDWAAILGNAVASFRRKLVVVLFTPLAPEFLEIEVPETIPVYRLPEAEVLLAFGAATVRRTDVRTDTQFGAETVFCIEKPEPSACASAS